MSNILLKINENIKKNVVFYVLLLSFLITMFLFSTYTSPLFPYSLGADSALFTLLGKGVLNGKILYKELFDHKGPVLFFIEALGYLLGGRSGIFLLQCVFGSINLYFIYKNWSILRTTNNNTITNMVFAFVVVYFTFYYTFQNGNLSEEYSLPLISACIYLFVKYSLGCQNNSKHPYKYSFVYGIMLTLLFFMRLNNAVTIATGILVIFIYLIYKREYKNLILNLLFGILGCIVVAVPICVYFALNSALYDMIYATFLYNFIYAGTTGHQNVIVNFTKYIVLYLPIICSFVFIVFHVTKNKKQISFTDVLISSIVVMNTICLYISNVFPHYFTFYMPVFALVLSKYFNFNIKNVKTILIVICAIVNISALGINFVGELDNNFVSRNYQATYQSVNNSLSIIPNNERDSVIGYNVPAAYYLYADIVPCYKYYTYQEWWSESDPSVNESFMTWLNTKTPSWLFTNSSESNSKLLEILSEKYNLVHQGDKIYIYKIKT